ncbi:phage protein Gp36 family protein [Roseospira goensis]|uniref:Phage gp36-like protein n=1 Tax=Roseospira goensis TaxID=391922 RepID=A0A7W6S2P8_9PROT|nr:phage protein Gp36 family protein [Roseospira goensis]MBB4287795.1 phage gp36-like protein [Roseospira goensis]
MTSYATAAEMIAQIGDHAAEDLAPADGGGVDTAALDDALARATEEIDGYLGGRYSLEAGLARSLCIVIARYRLATHAPPESREGRDYGDAVRYLRDVVAGKTGQRPLDAGGAPTGGAALVDMPPRLFGPGTLGGF